MENNDFKTKTTDYEFLNHWKICLEGDIARLHHALGSVESKQKVNDIKRAIDAASYSLTGIKMAANHRPEHIPDIIDYINHIIAICEHNSFLYKAPYALANPIPALKAFVADLTSRVNSQPGDAWETIKPEGK